MSGDWLDEGGAPYSQEDAQAFSCDLRVKLTLDHLADARIGRNAVGRLRGSLAILRAGIREATEVGRPTIEQRDEMLRALAYARAEVADLFRPALTVKQVRTVFATLAAAIVWWSETDEERAWRGEDFRADLSSHIEIDRARLKVILLEEKIAARPRARNERSISAHVRNAVEGAA